MDSTFSARKTRVGIFVPPQMWVGGLNYFRNLLIALEVLPESLIDVTVFTSRGNHDALDAFPPVRTVRTALMDRGSSRWVIRQIAAKLLRGDWVLNQLLRQHDIDIISHSGPLVRNSKIAAVGWIPDFQNLHLPQFFTDQERRLRDSSALELCRTCDRIILSSEAARSDLEEFAPHYAYKADVLHFIASPPTDNGAPTLAELESKHGFAGPYFLLPNQFWAHKNHRVVVTALKLLLQQHRRVLVIATGSTEDSRQPAFFGELMRYVEECGVGDRFRVLGKISFGDVAGLMRHAVAVINPSHFEGWSTSVEESKSLGKTIVLSDIPVHREQSPEYGIYFPPDDPAQLADALWHTWQQFSAESSREQQARALLHLVPRQVRFAAEFQRILLSARH